MKKEYDQHPITLPPDKAYSPASIGKAYLDAMGIIPPMQKFTLPDYIHGIAMQSYFGGRAECRIRKWPVPVVPVDFTSQYPTVNTLLGNFDVLTAESMSIEDVTNQVRKFLEGATLEKAFDPEFWKRLRFFALVTPDNDILPVRTVYNDSETQNIGINHLSSKTSMWFAGPDVVASIILNNGKVPHIEKALRIVPHGKQNGLNKTNLQGMVEVDPVKNDFYRSIVEQRKRFKSDKALAYFLKILANSSAYGLFVELNPKNVKSRECTKIQVFSGEREHSQSTSTIEEHGRWLFPVLAALITSGSRLLLALLEECVKEAGGTYLFCDTDSLAIVSSRKGEKVACPGGPVKLPEGREAIKALSWDEVQKIVDRFESLNPYNPKFVKGSILGYVDANYENDDPAKRRRQLSAFCISAKRYALYEIVNGRINIASPKAHGIGYFFPPTDRKHNDEKDGDPQWWYDCWEFIISSELWEIKHPGEPFSAKPPEWFDLPTMMRFKVNTPNTLHQLKNSVRPYNFIFIPRTYRDERKQKKKFTLVSTFTKDRSKWLGAKCRNIYTGREYILSEKNSGNHVRARQMQREILEFMWHPEHKSLGPDGKPCNRFTRGLLQRTPVLAGQLIPVGKETDRKWEDGEDISILDRSMIQYLPKKVKADQETKEWVRNYGIKRCAREASVDRNTVKRWVRGKRINHRKARRIMNLLHSQWSR